jgi:excisionase family DNA binding protein
MRIVRLTDDVPLAGSSQLLEPLQRIEERPPKLLLTPEEAAAALSISRSLLYQLLARKRVFSVKVEGTRRIPVRALTEYVDALCDQGKAG